MKNVLLLILLVTATSLTAQAQLKFYYYPSSNVYYNVAQKQYAYLNDGNWTQVSTLPANVKVARTPRYIVYNQTPEVWVKNQTHVKKYKAPKQKNYPNGKAVGYKGSNPNKPTAKGNGNGKAHKNGKH